MTTETTKEKNSTRYGCEETIKRQVDDYFVSRFVSDLKKEKQDKSVLVSELDSIIDGKNIVISNCK